MQLTSIEGIIDQSRLDPNHSHFIYLDIDDQTNTESASDSKWWRHNFENSLAKAVDNGLSMKMYHKTKIHIEI